MVRVLFVCSGNICRSPTAEGILRHLVEEAGLAEHVHVESAGTGGWHAGEPPDARSTATPAARGIRLSGRARQVTEEDLERFDYVVAMDRSHLSHLLRMADGVAELERRVRLARAFDGTDDDVPDPYYGGGDGFDRVFDVCEAACRGLLEEIRKVHGL